MTDVPSDPVTGIGYVPASDVVLRWATYTDAAEEAGMNWGSCAGVMNVLIRDITHCDMESCSADSHTGISRLYGGIHIPAANVWGQITGRKVGRAVFRKFVTLAGWRSPRHNDSDDNNDDRDDIIDCDQCKQQRDIRLLQEGLTLDVIYSGARFPIASSGASDNATFFLNRTGDYVGSSYQLDDRIGRGETSYGAPLWLRLADRDENQDGYSDLAPFATPALTNSGPANPLTDAGFSTELQWLLPGEDKPRQEDDDTPGPSAPVDVDGQLGAPIWIGADGVVYPVDGGIIKPSPGPEIPPIDVDTPDGKM